MTAERDIQDSPVPTIVEDSRKPNEIAEREAFPVSGTRNKDEYLVEFEPDDPLNPKNWNRSYRWFITILSGTFALNASFASSAPSGIVEQLMEKYTMSTFVATLTISLFVLGYCFGPIVWGPLSEQIGRKPVFVISFICYTGFQVGGALAQNTASILIFRLLGGTFAASPMTNSGAFIADIWDADTRGKAIAFFSVAPFLGPCLGPTVGGYINTAGVSWRWVFWVLTIFAGACTAVIIFVIPETYAPIILASKAKSIRSKTGNDKYYAPIEKNSKKGWLRFVNDIAAKPFKILFEEPMLLAVTIYMSFLYGCLYLLFEAYPIVFTRGHGMSTGASGLMFIPVFLGAISSVIIYIAYYNPRYKRLVAQYKPHLVPPEARLEMSLPFAPIFAIGFFWFGWTSYPSISYWAPMVSGLALGAGISALFLSLMNYIIDTYLYVAASALASSTIVRSIFGAGFPLFANDMYDSLNPRWASTLLGGISVLMIPIPYVLKRYGEMIRGRSKNAPKLPSAKVEPKSEV